MENYSDKDYNSRKLLANESHSSDYIDNHDTMSLEILDDLVARFILPLPLDVRSNHIRLCFAIEQAYWFYLNNLYNPEKDKKGSMKEFAAHIFRHTPFLRDLPYFDNVSDIIDTWRTYKLSIPIFGAVILNSSLTKVLLVRSCSGRKKCWGFPKGKINEDESFTDCAAREVLEETGVNVRALIKKDSWMEEVVCDQTVRLYIVPGVKENISLRQKSIHEIREVKWFNIKDLPVSTKDKSCKERTGYVSGSFFLILPFITKIQNWIEEEKKRGVSKLSLIPKNKKINATDEEKLQLNDELKMLPEQFMPETWKNFNLDKEEINMVFHGFPASFKGNMKYLA